MNEIEKGSRRGRTSDEHVVKCDLLLTEAEISDKTTDKVSVNNS